jgi:hypothetical protein
LIGRPHTRLIWVLARLAESPALPEEIPALIQLNLQGTQTTMFFRFVDLVVL